MSAWRATASTCRKHRPSRLDPISRDPSHGMMLFFGRASLPPTDHPMSNQGNNRNPCYNRTVYFCQHWDPIADRKARAAAVLPAEGRSRRRARVPATRRVCHQADPPFAPPDVHVEPSEARANSSAAFRIPRAPDCTGSSGESTGQLQPATAECSHNEGGESTAGRRVCPRTLRRVRYAVIRGVSGVREAPGAM